VGKRAKAALRLLCGLTTRACRIQVKLPAGHKLVSGKVTPAAGGSPMAFRSVRRGVLLDSHRRALRLTRGRYSITLRTQRGHALHSVRATRTYHLTII
jgi:hypothetical protein